MFEKFNTSMRSIDVNSIQHRCYLPSQKQSTLPPPTTDSVSRNKGKCHPELLWPCPNLFRIHSSLHFNVTHFGAVCTFNSTSSENILILYNVLNYFIASINFWWIHITAIIFIPGRLEVLSGTEQNPSRSPSENPASSQSFPCSENSSSPLMCSHPVTA